MSTLSIVLIVLRVLGGGGWDILAGAASASRLTNASTAPARGDSVRPRSPGLASAVRREPSNTDNVEDEMSVAKVSEISATSTTSFEDAIKEGIARGEQDAPQGPQRVDSRNSTCGSATTPVTDYQVNMMVTFIIDD